MICLCYNTITTKTTADKGGTYMTDKFIMKVLHERIVDTKKYRYTAGVRIAWHNGNIKQYQVIKRIPIECLDTTMALDRQNWKEVWCAE